METVRVACNAMATRFEIILHGADARGLRAAGEEALREVERLESQLSLYRETSEIARLNLQAATRAVRVSPTLFALLEQARTLWSETEGAFDITIAPLVRCWGFMHREGRIPPPEVLADALAQVGMERVALDAENLTVHFTSPGVMLDLGALGKGYAIEWAAEILRDCGVESALIHGGTSTIYAIGRPPDEDAWKVAIDGPPSSPATSGAASLSHVPAGPFATVPLVDQAMSVSAVWGRSFEAEGKTFGHLLDPRTGRPVAETLLCAVILPSATETDALSTALAVLGLEGQEKLAKLRPAMASLVVAQTEGRIRVSGRKIDVLAGR